jgi:HTH-type transcriptional regulator / antitoxin HipB
MSDLKKYIAKRKTLDKKFAKNYDANYEDLKISILLRTLREEAGLTQDMLATRMHTRKSAISRMENKAEDMRISTLIRFAAVLGKHVSINIA